MEVSGYPHYENVTSNMLAFLFDPDEEHELRDLMLRAFLRMAGHADIAEIGSVRIVREECTDSGNRIDLLIDAETFTICIENKIFAATNNDLGDYAKHLRRYSANKSVVVKALLGVKPYDEGQLGAGFRGFTYPQFWRHVRSLLGEYSASADPKWIAFLADLMQTTTDLSGGNMELQQSDDFFIKNDPKITKLIEARDDFLRRLTARRKEMLKLLTESSAGHEPSPEIWIWQDSCVAITYRLKEEIVFDLFLKPDGWTLQLFARKTSGKRYLDQLAAEPALAGRIPENSSKEQENKDRYTLEKWSVREDLSEIQSTVVEWMNRLEEAARTLKKTSDR